MPCCNLAVPAGVSATQEHNRPASRCRTRKGNIRIKLMRMECAWVCVGATARAGGVKQAQRGRRPSHETPRALRHSKISTCHAHVSQGVVVCSWRVPQSAAAHPAQPTSRRTWRGRRQSYEIPKAPRLPGWGSGGVKFTLGGGGSAWLAFYKAEAAWSCEKEARSKADAPSTP